MRKLVLLFLAFVSVSAFAQDIQVPTSLVVMEGNYKLDGVERNGFDVLVQGEEKAIIEAFTKYMNTKFDLKLKAKGNMASGEEFNNTVWSDKQFAIKSQVVKDGSGKHFQMFMLFGADIFVNSAQYASEAANAKVVVKEFAKAYYVGVFQKQLDDQTKVVTSQEKEVSGLNKDQAKNDKAIGKAEKSIAKSEKKISSSKSKIEKYKKAIMTSDNAIQSANKNIEKKKMEIAELGNTNDPDLMAKNAKKKAKYAKSIAKSEKSIAKAEAKKAKSRANIEKYENAIVKADKSIVDSRDYIKKKSGSAEKTASELEKEKDKFKNVSQDQEAIKAKIKAIQAL